MTERERDVFAFVYNIIYAVICKCIIYICRQAEQWIG